MTSLENNTSSSTSKNSSFLRALRWLDDHILMVLAGFLLAFIPLYPKIPLWSPIEQYIVRVRLEDLFILLTGIVWGIQFLRKKVAWKSAMLWMILAYAVVGALSTFVAVFVIKTVPLQPLHVGKTLLHYFRYLEYFSLFMIMYSAVRTRRDVKIALGIFAATVLAIVIYGYAQRYFYWPVYSTMNREFSKGIRLYLTKYARVQSTFAGHYDMAAFLVVSLPLLLAIAYKTTSKLASTALHWIFWIGTWLLVLSASRAPFAAFVGAAAIVLGLSALTQRSWAKKITFGLSRGVVFALFLSIVIYYFGDDLRERLAQVVNTQPQLKIMVEQANKNRSTLISDATLAKLPTPQQVQDFLPKSNPPDNGKSTDEVAAAIAAASAVASNSDQPPTPVNETPVASVIPVATSSGQLPGGVYEDIPDEEIITATDSTGALVTTVIKKPRVYSKCALEKELSLCIRQETLWPRAIEGFLTNPLTGSGYATLTKEAVDQFTEADSTDNNFLRTLGETGILGFITFYGCVGIVLYYAVRHVNDDDFLVSAMSIGLLGGSIGLLLNAVYIDVFAASKVAQMYWALSGIFLGFLATQPKAARFASPSQATQHVHETSTKHKSSPKQTR